MIIATVSLITSPDQYAPLNAGDGASKLWFQAESASASVLQDFAYLFDLQTVFPASGLFKKDLGTFRVPPRPTTNNGLFTGYKMLISQTTNSPLGFPITLTGSYVSDESEVRYQLGYGFECNPNLYFLDTYNATGSLGLSFSFQPGLTAGDQINLLMSNQSLNQQYNGSCLISAVDTNFRFVTNLQYGLTPSSASPVVIHESGVVNDLIRFVGTSSNNLWGWNGTRQYEQNNINFGTKYILQDYHTTGFLTYYSEPNTTTFIKPLMSTQSETLGFLANTGTYSIDEIIYTGFNSQMNLIQIATASIGITSSFRKFELGVGPANIQSYIGFTMSALTVYYQISLVDSGSATTRGVLWRRIDDTCSVYPLYRLTWLNRLGSYEYFNFIRASEKSLNISKNEIKKELPFNYSIGQRGRTVLSSKIDINTKIESDWLSQHDYEFLQEIFTSPEVYVVDGGGNRLPIIITDSTWTQKTYVKDVLFNLQLNFVYAYQLVSQVNN